MKNSIDTSKIIFPLIYISGRLKKGIKIIVILLILSSATSLTPQKASAQVNLSFQVFYDELSPYGTWVDNYNYGYVWVPRVSHGFTPYGTNGYWVNTNMGWTWVSNYRWGWAPFHYGRWFYDDYYGWVWVPDNEWGPGWVVWRSWNGYYGWAPIGPGISIGYAYSDEYYLPHHCWRFVRDRHFGRRDVSRNYVGISDYMRIIKNSSIVKNDHDNRNDNTKNHWGPERKDAEKRSGKTFAPLSIKESNQPIQNVIKNQMEIYRPHVENPISTEIKPAPSKITIWKGAEIIKENQPVKQPPIRTEPIREQQPVREQPPIKQAPIIKEQEPIRQEPIREQQPVREQPPIKHAPIIKEQELIRQEPIREQHPVREQQPTRKQPDQPIRQQPTMRDPEPVRENRPSIQNQKTERPIKSFPLKNKPKKQQH